MPGLVYYFCNVPLCFTIKENIMARINPASIPETKSNAVPLGNSFLRIYFNRNRMHKKTAIIIRVFFVMVVGFSS
jgi:hypothetical protein